MKYGPIDLSKVKTVSLAARRSLVKVEQFGRGPKEEAGFHDWLAGLPDVLGAKALREIVAAIVRAREDDRPVIFGMGAHVVKVGLAPVLIELMERGAVTALAMNGAAMIHDVEIALRGATSERVGDGLADGTFGMAEETGRFVNEAAAKAAETGLGLGQAAGAALLAAGARHADLSLLAAAVRLELPATVHVAIGTDIVHMQPTMDGAATGEATMTDYRILCSVVADLEGGVYLNVGSAVILPEIFVKALTVARNLGHTVEHFTTANLDFVQHYRPLQNVVGRPSQAEGSQGYALTGHHELLVPLLAQAVIDEMWYHRR
ncbi:MAG: hypothetical protein C4521_11320 [Actinobacteria bacterium]|nr:MAG: hypothetical protein C4521_11320 [Actinomycetota bacterium]